MPELSARGRLLCGHRLGAAGSPGNLIGGDKARPGDKNSAPSRGPEVLGGSAGALEDHRPGSRPLLSWVKAQHSPRPQTPKGLP